MPRFHERRWLHLCFIACLGILVYSNTFHVPFLFDGELITSNHLIKDLDNFLPGGSGESGSFGNRWVAYFTFALNYRLHGLDVTGYHVVNLFIHILNALLVYWLVLLTVRTPIMKQSRLSADNGRLAGFVALFTSLLFVAHPVQTQAVTYIYQRSASLATLFYLFSLAAYIEARLSQGAGEQRAESREQRAKSSTVSFPFKSILWYSAAVLSALLAVKTKEISFTLPVVIVLYELMFFEGARRKLALGLGPLLLLIFIVPFAYLGINKPISAFMDSLDSATRVQTDMSRLDYLFTQFRVIVTYLRLLFVPVNQNVDYDYPVYHSLFDAEVFFSFLLLLSIFCAGCYLVYRSRADVGDDAPVRRRADSGGDLRLIAFGIFWFFITLSIESSVIPIFDVIFEHRIYLPSFGFFSALVATVFLVADRYGSRGVRLFGAAVLACCMVVTVYSVAAYARNRVWDDELVFWNDIAKKAPNNCRAYSMLGAIYSKKNSTELALHNLLLAIKCSPDNEIAYVNLGHEYRRQGKRDRASVYFAEALRIRPTSALARLNMGASLFEEGSIRQSIEYFQSAIAVNPSYAEAYYHLGRAFRSLGMFDRSLREYEEAIRLNPDYYQAYNSLGVLYESVKSYEKAEYYYSRAVQLRPSDTISNNNLRRVLQVLGK